MTFAIRGFGECNEKLTTIAEEQAGYKDIGFLSRSPSRFNLLVALQHSPQSQAALRQQSNIPQSTLRRVLFELEEHNWIEEVPTENSYRILPAGRIAIHTFSMAVETMDTANCLGRFLDRLPLSIPVDAPALGECEITACHPHAPYAPIYSFLEVVRGSDTLKSMSPVIDPMCVNPLMEQFADGFKLEFIGSSKGIDQLRTVHSSAFETLSDIESAQLLVTDEVPQFAVNILEDRATIMTYDHTMRPDSLLIADRDQHQIIDWAEQQYLTCADTAETYHR